MKIEKLYIDSFGKFKNYEIEFSDGLNIIKRENGAGKSTMIAFIKAMLYGFGDNKGAEIRKVYMPWSGEGLCGRMQFSHDNKSYVIARTAGKAKRSDTCTVYDALTGEEVDFDIESVIGIGQAGFEKTLYIRQMGIADIKDGEDELTTRLLNLAQTQNEDESYDEAIAILDKAKTTLVHKRGRGGYIPELEDKIAELEAELYDIEAAHKRLRAELYDLSRTSKIRDRLKTEIQALENDREAAKLRTEKREALKRLQEQKQELLLIEKDYLLKEKTEQSLKEKLKQLDKFSTEKPVPKKAHSTVIALRIILPVLFLLLAAAGFIFKAFIPASLFVVCAIAAFLVVTISIQRKTHIREEFLREHDCSDEQEYIDMLSLYKKTEQQAYEASVNCAAAQQNFIHAKKSYEEKQKVTPSDASVLEGADTESLEKIIASKKMVYEKEGERLVTVQTAVGTVLAGKREIDEVYADLSEKREELLRAKENYQALTLATDTLKDVFMVAQRDFAPRLNLKVKEIFRVMTNDDAEPLVSQKMEIRLDGHQIEEYSAGIADQMYFALRMALTELLIDAPSPILLDDPFVQYDEDRFNSTMRYLNSAVSGRQIIYFTCHERGQEEVL